ARRRPGHRRGRGLPGRGHQLRRGRRLAHPLPHPGGARPAPHRRERHQLRGPVAGLPRRGGRLPPRVRRAARAAGPLRGHGAPRRDGGQHPAAHHAVERVRPRGSRAGPARQPAAGRPAAAHPSAGGGRERPPARPPVGLPGSVRRHRLRRLLRRRPRRHPRRGAGHRAAPAGAGQRAQVRAVGDHRDRDDRGLRVVRGRALGRRRRGRSGEPARRLPRRPHRHAHPGPPAADPHRDLRRRGSDLPVRPRL
ncbi:MAG: Uncharacterized UPF0721 integral membrane protein, partial [uncultured Pseudonocardia sp.]